MPDPIHPLLRRAAELAPEWCRIDEGYFWLGDEWVHHPLPNGKPHQGRILWAVLKECERRGLRHGISCTDGAWIAYVFPDPPENPVEAWGALHADGPDPATASLTALIAYLESMVEA